MIGLRLLVSWVKGISELGGMCRGRHQLVGRFGETALCRKDRREASEACTAELVDRVAESPDSLEGSWTGAGAGPFFVYRIHGTIGRKVGRISQYERESVGSFSHEAFTRGREWQVILLHISSV